MLEVFEVVEIGGEEGLFAEGGEEAGPLVFGSWGVGVEKLGGLEATEAGGKAESFCFLIWLYCAPFLDAVGDGVGARDVFFWV